jgi:hypothetical protein
LKFFENLLEKKSLQNLSDVFKQKIHAKPPYHNIGLWHLNNVVVVQNRTVELSPTHVDWQWLLVAAVAAPGVQTAIQAISVPLSVSAGLPFLVLAIC